MGGGGVVIGEGVAMLGSTQADSAPIRCCTYTKSEVFLRLDSVL